jgi:hypothetical protein
LNCFLFNKYVFEYSSIIYFFVLFLIKFIQNLIAIQFNFILFFSWILKIVFFCYFIHKFIFMYLWVISILVSNIEFLT